MSGTERRMNTSNQRSPRSNMEQSTGSLQFAVGIHRPDERLDHLRVIKDQFERDDTRPKGDIGDPRRERNREIFVAADVVLSLLTPQRAHTHNAAEHGRGVDAGQYLVDGHAAIASKERLKNEGERHEAEATNRRDVLGVALLPLGPSAQL
eukprot:3093639-Prymnesium_polylepis.1